jgi:hypothetical protein
MSSRHRLDRCAQAEFTFDLGGGQACCSAFDCKADRQCFPLAHSAPSPLRKALLKSPSSPMYSPAPSSKDGAHNHSNRSF